MEDQPLPTNASPTALLPSYINDSNPEEDEEDPEEDPVHYPANGGDNDDNESSDDDDDVKKDGEDDEEAEHLALVDPSVVPIDDYACLTEVAIALPSSLPPPLENIKMSIEEIERVVAQQVANAIKAIAIYETKTNLARKSMIQTKRQKEKVAENASNKRKWEGNHNGSSSQQNKRHKVPRAHTAWPINKKAYAGSLPLTPATAKNQRTRTCYECGSLRHYKSECPIVKFHKRVDIIHGRVRASKPKTMQDAIKIATKLLNKKISTLAKYQTENKKRLDNTSKNNQNQHQQPNKRQNTGWVYTAASGKRKEYAGTLPLCNKYKFHHNGQCTVKCVNCKRVSHLTRDYRSPVATNNHRNPTCYECRNQGQYRSDCPELKN
nr:reverse transcriptase domain-containing protein [Tanacetum cinerariifolium]